MVQLLNLHPQAVYHIHSLDLKHMRNIRPYFLLLSCCFVTKLKRNLIIMHSKYYSWSLLKTKLFHNRQLLTAFKKLLISTLFQVNLKWMCTSPLEPSPKIKLPPCNGHFPPIFSKFLMLFRDRHKISLYFSSKVIRF